MRAYYTGGCRMRWTMFNSGAPLMDSGRLSWKKHITMQTNKVIMTYWACRRMFGNTWGPRPRIVKWSYTAIMLPQLAYAAVVWWTAMNKACHRKTVDRTGRHAMLGITGALRTTSTSALEALLFLQPPHLPIKEVALISAARLRLQGRWKEASSGHAAMLTADSDLRGLLSWGGDACGPRWHLQKSFKVNLGYGATQLGSDRKWTPPKGLVWALGLDPHTTVLQAELAALKACAREILGRGDSGEKIYICSDSRRALRALLKNESCSRLVNDCTELMERVASHNQLEVVWIPGHAGIFGNMKADELAKRGCLEVAPTEENPVGVHIDFVKDMIWKRAERGVVESGGKRLVSSDLSRPFGSGGTRRIFLSPVDVMEKVGEYRNLAPRLSDGKLETEAAIRSVGLLGFSMETLR
ncbi:uncharacterized protein [Fopius arisanus]|uniref:RNase H type-1 domain-containing protein n=1 Tax=Fopius arisanus TaxID=64838 RepID=A0A9R1THQ6_9HYME|nr:PREDICTED: uncharacterized protein LOC105270319 [Fopius arisanus]